MKKLKLFLTAFLLMFVLAFTGCQSEETKETVTEESFMDEEMELVEGDQSDELNTDEELYELTEEELAGIGEFTETYGADVLPDGSSEGITEDGTYTAKDDVASYIYSFGHLPSNFITKNEAKNLGWNSEEGNLGEVAPGMSIGGDKFGNYEGLLPEAEGRVYYECDIDFDGNYRNAKRIVYSNDGLIFYTEDHYESFEQLY